MKHIQQVTLFGGSGFVGRVIARSLAQEGYRVRVAARRPELAEAVKTAGDVGQVVLMRANLRAPASIAAAVAGSQAVINASGIPFQRGRQSYQAVHVDGARTIAEAASAAGVKRLIHISGIGASDRESPNRFVRSKAQGESAIVAGFAQATILRPSIVFGPDDTFFNKLGSLAALAPVIPLIGKGAARMQPVYVGDVARAVVAALAEPATARSVYELGGPHIYTYRELMALVLRVTDRQKPILTLPVGLMKLGAFFAELVPLLPPAITRDQVDLVTRDNVVAADARTLASLGIVPTAAEVILPTYLDRFRIGGRYNQHAPA